MSDILVRLPFVSIIVAEWQTRRTSSYHPSINHFLINLQLHTVMPKVDNIHLIRQSYLPTGTGERRDTRGRVVRSGKKVVKQKIVEMSRTERMEQPCVVVTVEGENRYLDWGMMMTVKMGKERI
jgi:hypothetical protein